MYVTMTVSAESRRSVKRMERRVKKLPGAIDAGLQTATAAGAGGLREFLVLGRSGLTMQRPGSGMASDIQSWRLGDKSWALGTPSNSPSYRYAAKLNRGGIIRAKPGKALAIPISAEAKKHTSPRDMAGLVFISRSLKGKPPLLARVHAKQLDVHWVLLKSVTLPAFQWFTQGVKHILPDMRDDFSNTVKRKLEVN